MSTLLDSITTYGGASEAPPLEAGKLTTAQVLITMAQMGAALQKIAEAYEKLPHATPSGVDNHLDDIIVQAKSIQGKAERLKVANR